MKYTREQGFKIKTIVNNNEIIIGRDRGSRDVKTFYYVEINGKIIQHWFGTQKDAKKHLVDKVLKQLNPINDDKKLEQIADEQGQKIATLK
jgi:hypothetical protein